MPVLVALATFLAFFPSLGNDFVNWDDWHNFLDNPAYRGLGPAQLRWMFTTFFLGHYQPLSWATLGLDYVLWGMNPLGYHLTSLLLHCSNASLFYGVSLRLLAAAAPQEDRSRLRLGAAAAALVFSLHPLRVESVAWATERRDVLSGFFYLGALLLYLKGRVAAAAAAFGLSLLSKASGISLPVVLVILDLYPLRRLPSAPRRWLEAEFRPVWREKLAFAGLSVLAGTLAVMAQRSAGALLPLGEVSLAGRLALPAFSTAFYLWKTAAPFNLLPLYQRPIAWDPWAPSFLIAAAAVVGLSAALIGGRRRFPAGLAAGAAYLAVLAPVMGFVPVGPYLAADRLTYLPCLPFALLAGAALMRLGSAARAGAFFVAVGLGFLTWRQTRVWHDSQTLWRHVLAGDEDCYIAHNNLGVLLGRAGQAAEAIGHYRRAIAINPVYPEARSNLCAALGAEGPGAAAGYLESARRLFSQGRRQEAVEDFQAAVCADPGSAAAHNDLGYALAGQGAIDEGITHFRRALEIDPRLAPAHNNWGMAAALAGKPDEAIAHFRRALALDPSYDRARGNMELVLKESGKKASLP